MGVDKPGDMEALAKWIKPDVAVLTRLPDVPVHVESFVSPEAVIQEKMALVRNLKSSGVLVYNHDDVLIQKQLPEVRQKTIGYARYSPAEITASKDRIFYKDDVPAGVRFTITTPDGSAEIEIKDFLGTQQMYAAGAAIATARHLGVSTEDAVKGLQTLVPPPGRLRVIKGLKGSVLLDDSYNSSPIAVEHALEAMMEVKPARRKIAVLGDMLELGKYSADEHKRLGAVVANSCDALLTIGIRARGFAAGALAAGMDESVIFQYEKTPRAGRELQSMLQPGDVVLIKGSQGIRMERIVEEVMAEPQLAETLLARQERAWKNTP
jgi:UDP-N-acetylmuramoyl-tripeptide--D-alanyl-D-alanine ligase